MSDASFLLPKPHMHKLLDEAVPACRYDGTSDLTAWQTEARARLSSLLGIDEIRPYAVDDPDLVVEYDRESDTLGCREIRFSFRSERDVRVPCVLLVPDGAERPLPVVICLQGHATGMHISLAQPKYPGDEETISGGDRDFARRAVREGLCALAVEQRCFGEAGGTPKGPDCREAAMRALLLGRTLIGERVWDIMRAIDVLEASFASVVDAGRVVCLGNSGGGTATTYAAALETRIGVAVPSCAVCRYADSIGAMLHCECNFVPGIARDFDMGDLCAMIAPRSLIVVSGREDPIFPLDGARASVAVAAHAYAAVGVPERLSHVVGAGGHRFYADDSWGLIRKAVDAIR